MAGVRVAIPPTCPLVAACLSGLDDGRLTDAQGRTVDFRHGVVIMTSSIGAHRILAHQGDAAELMDELMDDLQGRLLPEFLNGIDDIIILHSLTEEDLSEIVEHLLDRSKHRVRAQGPTLEVTEAAKKLPVAPAASPSPALVRCVVRSRRNSTTASPRCF